MPKTVNLTEALRAEYVDLFQTCRVRESAHNEVTTWANRIASGRDRYTEIEDETDVPWYITGILHYRECSLSFQKHLHNGDPLDDCTVHVPAGRPKQGEPPFTFEASAIDALTFNGAASWSDWSLGGTLYRLEKFNGFGYRLYHPEVLSPYLWGKSNHYSKGGYPADGKWSDDYVNKQLGAAVLLRRLAELGHVAFAADGSRQDAGEVVSVWSRFENVRYRPNVVVPLALELQKALNQVPGIQLKEDGKAGQRTSDAFMRVTGRRLKGDPRGD